MATAAINVRGALTLAGNPTVDTITFTATEYQRSGELQAIDGTKAVWFNVGNGAQAAPTAAGTAQEYLLAAVAGRTFRFVIPAGSTTIKMLTDTAGTPKVYFTMLG